MKAMIMPGAANGRKAGSLIKENMTRDLDYAINQTG
jgi:hypothetical protein